jgi:uncharacterized membrane protein
MRDLREFFAFLGAFGPVVWLARIWNTLPEQLPSHFGLDGEPNHYASRDMVLLIAGLSIGMYVLLLVMQRLPKKMNLPRRAGDADRPRVEALAVEMLGWLRLELAWTFAYLIWSVVQVGLYRSEGLGAGFIYISVGAVMGTIVWFLLQMKKRPVEAQA